MFSHLPAARAVTTPFGELHVVSVVFNPLRFASRYYLLKDFKKHVQCSGAIVHVAEAAQGDRPWEVTGPEDMQWRVRDELWLKESMINAAVARLPDERQYVEFDHAGRRGGCVAAVTQEGKVWIANLYANVFAMEHKGKMALTGLISDRE
jgi:hypothetical protein